MENRGPAEELREELRLPEEFSGSAKLLCFEEFVGSTFRTRETLRVKDVTTIGSSALFLSNLRRFNVFRATSSSSADDP